MPPHLPAKKPRPASSSSWPAAEPPTLPATTPSPAVPASPERKRKKRKKMLPPSVPDGAAVDSAPSAAEPPTLPAITTPSPVLPQTPERERKRRKKKLPPSEPEGAGADPMPSAAERPTLSSPTESEPRPPNPHGAAAKEPLPVQRAWPPGDELRVLEALAEYRREHGDLPSLAALFAALDGHLEKKGVTKKALDSKTRTLKRRYETTGEHEHRVYLLSKDVWGHVTEPNCRGSPPEALAATGDETGKGEDALVPKARTLGEVCELYPFLVHEAMELYDDPAILETVLPSVDDDEARALNSKIKRIRKKIHKMVKESARVTNMETPTIYLSPSTKLQAEKLRSENGNNLIKPPVKAADDNCVHERLAQLGREFAELKQLVLASQSQAKIGKNQHHDISSAKGVRCASAESRLHLRSIVADNPIPRNMLQKKIEAPNGFPCGKNKEVTSKYNYTLPSKFAQANMKHPLIQPPLSAFRARRAVDAESLALHNTKVERKIAGHVNQEFCRDRNMEAGEEVVLLSIIWPHAPAAHGILETSSPFTMVGDMQLGNQYSKVNVTRVLRGNHPIARSYGNMKMMLHALNCSIAWPREQIRRKTVPGMVVPDPPSHQAEKVPKPMLRRKRRTGTEKLLPSRTGH